MKKIDRLLTWTIIALGFVYCFLTVTQYVLPGKLTLDKMFFPGIATVYIIVGFMNLTRVNGASSQHHILCIISNIIALAYAAYLTYLVKVAIPPYIATSVLLFATILSFFHNNHSKGSNNSMQPIAGVSAD